MHPHHNFPFSKKHAVCVETYLPGSGGKHILFPIKGGEFEFPSGISPDRCRHYTDGAWNVGNLEVEIGEIVKSGDVHVDDFNQLLLDLLNIQTGNMLLKGNTLCWNIWVAAPTCVDVEEWRNHAENWRESISQDEQSELAGIGDLRYRNGDAYHDDDTKRELALAVEKLRNHGKE
jgi:hypothetical protein